jgi:hypothetical protein
VCSSRITRDGCRTALFEVRPLSSPDYPPNLLSSTITVPLCSASHLHVSPASGQKYAPHLLKQRESDRRPEYALAIRTPVSPPSELLLKIFWPLVISYSSLALLNYTDRKCKPYNGIKALYRVLITQIGLKNLVTVRTKNLSTSDEACVRFIPSPSFARFCGL